MLKPFDQYFLQQSDPATKSCLLAMRSLIGRFDDDISEAWKYGMPFFCYRGKMCCYLWVHKKYRQPYLGIVEGQLFDDPFLLQEKRARMKILLLDPNKDIPFRRVQSILKKMLLFYNPGPA